ncbi:unnamed protein product [Ambrosiozyma monospora]|uniref:Unnamed protein product n=1 Tax=Ambrosiozyma monospora TaxID=43982 RepID=A0ACB5TEP2_AMBMO|nr:unnamed protein product [Ambrosiozyma monospora]
MNIKVTSNLRAKRKRAEGGEDADAASAPAGSEKTGFMSAYDDALYGESDSEDESDDDSDDDRRGGKRSHNKSKQFISESKDAPLDLLDKQTLQHISSSKPKKFTKKNLEKSSNFKTKNGKLVIGKDGEDDDVLSGKNSIDAYVDAIKQGPIRGQRNKLKFKKDSKKDNIDWDSDDEDEKPRNKRDNFKGGKRGVNKVNKPKQKFKSRKKF